MTVQICVLLGWGFSIKYRTHFAAVILTAVSCRLDDSPTEQRAANWFVLNISLPVRRLILSFCYISVTPLLFRYRSIALRNQEERNDWALVHLFLFLLPHKTSLSFDLHFYAVL